MITFNQKQYSEYECMKLLWEEIKKNRVRNIELIDKSSLIPILKGNNIVIEKFVLSTSFLGKTKYRMYLKMGARVKMPDKVKLPSFWKDRRDLGRASVTLSGTHQWRNDWRDNFGRENNYSEIEQENLERFFSELVFDQKEFGNDNKNKGPKGPISAKYEPNINLQYEVEKDLGDVIQYDKTSRSLVLEFPSVENAIRSLTILPFGLEYNVYLLNS